MISLVTKRLYYKGFIQTPACRSFTVAVANNTTTISTGRKLDEPADPTHIEEMVVKIGDYAEQIRTYTGEDLRHFSEVIHDVNATHKNPEKNEKTFFRPDIVYGILSSSMFTSLWRAVFPKCIYMGQEMKFVKPVIRDAKIRGKV